MKSAAATRSVLFLTHDRDAPSFRYRLLPTIPHLEALGFRCRIETLPQRQYGYRIWTRRHLLRSAAAVVLAKLRLEPWEMRLLRRFNSASVFDVDDAIYLRQPKWIGHERGTSSGRQRKFAGMCRYAGLTIAGNSVLAARAAETSAHVEIVPTSVDASAYPPSDPDDRNGRTAVWIGLPNNLQYLERVRPALAAVAARNSGFRLRVISSDFPDWTEVPIERVPWSPQIEKQALMTADIGLMPLTDDGWSRGKCAFKLLQYMAAGLPCIASPVGANREVVLDGQTGYLSDSPAAWETALQTLFDVSALRESMGRLGRERALALYDRPVICARMANLIAAVADGKLARAQSL